MVLLWRARINRDMLSHLPEVQSLGGLSDGPEFACAVSLA
jgi:hypothetical protein